MEAFLDLILKEKIPDLTPNKIIDAVAKYASMSVTCKHFNSSLMLEEVRIVQM